LAPADDHLHLAFGEQTAGRGAQVLLRGKVADRQNGCRKRRVGNLFAFVDMVRSQCADLLGNVGDNLLKLAPLRGRDPTELNAAHVKAEQIEEVAEERPPAPGVKITGVVVAVAWMA